MADAHFISYSSADALEFTLKLANALIIGPPSFPVWLDEGGIRPGDNWDSQIAEAIKQCESMIFVMSLDSVEDKSVCKQEWTRAFRYKKPVTPLLLHPKAEMPFRFGSRQFIDFTGDFAIGLAKLQNHLTWLASPAGQLQALKDRLADANRGSIRASDDVERARIADEITLLTQQIAEQEHALAHPKAAAQAVQTRIETGLERERQPERPVSSEARTKFINPPPGDVPSYFQDRFLETRLLAEQLKDESKRLLTVVGRGGVGKTTMVCRLLKGIEAGRLPDDLGKELGELTVDGLIYLNQNGTRQISAANLFTDLCKLLPAAEAQQMEALYRDPQIATDTKVKTLLAHFARQRVIVLLDNLEDLIDTASRQLKDAELNEMLLALLRAPVHGVKVLCTTRIAPQGLALVQPQLQYTVALDEGLESPYAENILRSMDSDGKLKLKDAPASLLATARERTRGYPRALEALVAILSSDRGTKLPELLGDKRAFLPDNVVEELVGEAYSRLDRTAQMVMQALAIYARPVTATAVDYLLQPHVPAVDAAAALSRLVNMYFASKEGDRYYLHPVDRAYALERVAQGNPGDGIGDDRDGPPPFTRYALWRRGADYFAQARLPRGAWKRLEDLSAQLAEIDLRCTGQEYSTAADVLAGINAYLELWGYARLLVDLHEHLRGKLSDPKQASVSLNYLGNAYADLGQAERAIEHYQQALAIARKSGDRQGEGVHLGNLGVAFADLGQVKRALQYYEQARVIAKEIGNRRDEGTWLSRVGNAYADLGQVARAIEHYKPALAIAQEIRDRRQEGRNLGRQGNAYAALGQVARAIEHYEPALAIAEEIGDRMNESLNLANEGLARLDLGDPPAALERLILARTIAVEIASAECRSEAGHGLALARLVAGDLPVAREAIEEAAAIPYPRHGPRVAALHGVIALRQADAATAAAACRDASEQAQRFLAPTPELVAAQEALGLATAGLALLASDEAEARRLAAEAADAYRAARAITTAPGIVGRAVRLLDALAPVDPGGLLGSVRSAATG